MIAQDITYVGGPIFDGDQLRHGMAARFRAGLLSELVPEDQLSDEDTTKDLGGDILSPGYTDLQVNGGGGVLFNDDPSSETLDRIATAHRRLGTVRILPTLITDTAEKTRAAIAAAIAAIKAGVPGIAGLHLEGPHLSVARKGAHDGALIRPMEDGDLAALLEAARSLPALMVTIAPESVSKDQVSTLVEAGIRVSLGHTNADFDTCIAYAKAGATCATHLFNAMSQLGNREPGLVGAVLQSGALNAGLIADGVHVHPASLRAAWTAKTGPGRIFLVSDAMAVAGTDQTEFHLGDRLIRRTEGRLTLEDGTLAGADLDLTTAVHTLTRLCGVPLDMALAAATTVPAQLIGATRSGSLIRGSAREACIRISADLSGAAPLV